MKRRLQYLGVLLTCLVIQACAPFKLLEGPSDPLSPTLHFDGLYQGPEETWQGYRGWSYLRIMPNGDVVDVSSIGTPQEVIRWLNPDRINASKGRVTLQGKKISFSTVSSAGQVDYLGEVNGSQIVLDIYSRINGHTTKGKVFTFVSVVQ